MTCRHIVYGYNVFDADQLDLARIPPEAVALMVPVTCEVLRDWYGYECQHLRAVG